MVTRAIRRSVRRPEGQAMVVACLMMVIVAIAVITTVNLGHNISERIKLQNTADSAAYSTAAMEARAFNFYAFANRTQVSHYVAAMTWTTFDSFIYFVESFLTDAYGFFKTMNFVCESSDPVWVALCLVLKAVPGVNVVINVLQQIMNGFKYLVQGLQTVVSGYNQTDHAAIDRAIGGVAVPMFQYMNSALSALQQAVMYSMLTHVLPGATDVVEKNDPNLRSTLRWQLLTGTLSACMFDRAHFDEAGGAPFSLGKNPLRALTPKEYADGSKVARAKKAMASISNATRYGCDIEGGGGLCPSRANTNRRLGDMLGLPSLLQPLTDLLNDVKDGQTRLLSYRQAVVPGGGRRAWKNHIQSTTSTPTAPIGMTAQGDNLGADDTYRLSLGPAEFSAIGFSIRNPLACEKEVGKMGECWGNPTDNPQERLKTSIWALNSGDGEYTYQGASGIHWRLQPVRRWSWRNTERDVKINHQRVCLLKVLGKCVVPKIDQWFANVIPVGESWHPWKGITPFSHFEPGQYQADCATGAFRSQGPSSSAPALNAEEFNQPSTWSMLQKTREELKNPIADPTASRNTPALINSNGIFALGLGSSLTELNLDNDDQPIAMDGMMVFSRGQVYYHRPGVWSEQPNFFNPYWRPRLASTYQGYGQLPLLKSTVEKLPTPLNRFPQKFLTH